MKAYQIPIQDIKQETEQAVSLTLGIPHELKTEFAYQAGQYLTVEASINGEKVRRAYSMSSSPVESQLPIITIKQVNGGKMSNYLCKKVETSDLLTVFPPQGKFIVQPNVNAQKNYALFGAGSGITPLMSILKTILLQEPQSTVTLFYGNTQINTIIFKNELAFWAQKYASKFKVIHYLSHPSENWTGYKGRIDAQQTQYLVETYLSTKLENTTAFICGPNAMIETVSQTLQTKGMAATQINSEYFVLKNDEIETPNTSNTALSSVAIGFKFDDQIHNFEGDANKTILKNIVDAGFEVPYSCQAGACCSCMALLTQGKASTNTQDMLTENEKQTGLRLTCQAKPLSNSVFVDFDAV